MKKRNDKNDTFLDIFVKNDRTTFFFGNGLVEEKMDESTLKDFLYPYKIYTFHQKFFGGKKKTPAEMREASQACISEIKKPLQE